MKSKKEARISANFLYQRFMLSEIKSQKNVIGSLCRRNNDAIPQESEWHFPADDFRAGMPVCAVMPVNFH
jgi:hypothetical protein